MRRADVDDAAARAVRLITCVIFAVCAGVTAYQRNWVPSILFSAGLLTQVWLGIRDASDS